MKLCLISPTPPPYGGVANWKQIIENEISKDKTIELSFIDISANKRPMDGRNFYDKYIYSGYVMLRAFFQLRRIIRHNKPDVVHLTTSGGMGFYRDLLLLELLKRKRIPSVYHIHFGRTVQYKENGGRCWKQIRKAVSLSSCTITIDHPTYEILKVYSQNIVEINNPIDVHSYETIITSEKKIITYLGWMIKTKGVEELIEGFKKFNSDKGKDYQLYLIGPGEEEYINKLKSKANENIKFFGELEHNTAMQILAESQALVLPSYTEGFPNVILEAMSLRKFVIASSVGAIPDILDNEAGLLIEPKKSDAIKMAFDKLLDESYRRKIADNSYKKVQSCYDVGITMEKYKAIWNNYI